MTQRSEKKIVNEIIDLGIDILQFESIFEHYDKYLSGNQNSFNVLLETNEFNHLKSNEYFKQAKEKVKKEYSLPFKKIHKAIGELSTNNASSMTIKNLKKTVSLLSFSKKHLQENVFDLARVKHQVSKKKNTDKLTKDEFIHIKKKFEEKLNSYISKFPN